MMERLEALQEQFVSIPLRGKGKGKCATEIETAEYLDFVSIPLRGKGKGKVTVYRDIFPYNLRFHPLTGKG